MKLARAGVTKITRAEDLSGSALIVLGLMNMGIEGITELADHLIRPGVLRESREHRRKARGFVVQVKYSDDPLVTEYREQGLPPGVFTPLPFQRYGDRVWCGVCRTHLNTVPCPLCCVRQVGRVADEPEVQEVEPPLPAQPVTCQPGSLQKLRVFQARLTRKESLFHPDDYSLAT